MKLLTLFVFSSLSFSCFSDEFHLMLQYTCDLRNDVVSVTYRGAYNETGKLMLSNLPVDSWSPSELIETDERGEKIIKMHNIEKLCQLSDGIYKVIISPVPGNTYTQRQCGYHLSASASVFKEKDLLNREIFHDECNNGDSPVVYTEIGYNAKSKSKIAKTISKKQFFNE